MEIELSYTPLNPELTERDFDLYLLQPGRIKVAEGVAISPLEKAMKSDSREVFEFPDFSVTRKDMKKTLVQWEKIYSHLLKFLEIRADDSRAAKMPGLQKFEGVGYCIAIPTLLDEIKKQQEKATSESGYPQLFWPKKKKDEEPVREILIPDRNYSVITPENALVVLNAKKFCTSLETEVVRTFSQANQLWFEKETGYSKDNIPKKEDSPLKRARKFARGKYAFVALVREEVPQYKEILGMLTAELEDLKNGVALEGYRTKQEKGNVYVNIKNVFERLSFNRIKKDGFVDVQARYEIVP